MVNALETSAYVLLKHLQWLNIAYEIFTADWYVVNVSNFLPRRTNAISDQWYNF